MQRNHWLTSQSADRKAQESLPHFLDTKQERLFLFGPLTDLLRELEDDTDPYLIYLRGLLHMRLSNRQEAVECFMASLKERPYNWSCWSQMAQLANSADMVSLQSFTDVSANDSSLSSKIACLKVRCSAFSASVSCSTCTPPPTW